MTLSTLRPPLKDPPNKLCWSWVLSQPAETVIARLRENEALWDALGEEIGDNVRERDAVIAEGWLRVHGWEPTQDVGRMIAAAIRARGDDG